MSTDLIVTLLGLQLFFLPDHPQSKQSHQHSMACVSEHDGEQEGEADDGEWRCEE